MANNIVSLLEVIDLLHEERKRLQKEKKWWQWSHPLDDGVSHATKVLIEYGRQSLKKGKSIGNY